jgi:hypothetical protein
MLPLANKRRSIPHIGSTVPSSATHIALSRQREGVTSIRVRRARKTIEEKKRLHAGLEGSEEQRPAAKKTKMVARVCDRCRKVARDCECDLEI